VVAVIALVVGLLVSRDRTIEVPELVGLTKDVAESRLATQGLRAEMQPQNDPNCTPNEVINQEPARGAAVPPNSTVRLTWCAGAGEVTIPKVIGLQEAYATSILTGLKLKVRTESVDSSKQEGEVVGVTPAEGETVAEGTEITLQVSKGNYEVVPDVRGYTEEFAKGILHNAGFAYVQPIPRPVDNPAEDGIVVGQSPEGGTEANPTFQVNIYIGDYTPPQSSPSPSASPSPSPNP
jgi:beta-lactam-binding protein with PASTA domain